MKKDWDVLVIGGGHAGVEAVHAAWKMGAKAGLISMEKAAIGRMSCNPAIGGVAKGQIVRDIDALGGLMGVLTDKAGIQFRMLNESKGPAVWGPRAQADMDLYSTLAREYLENCEGLGLIEDDILSLAKVGEAWRLQGKNASYQSASIIIASGTFLDAVMYTGFTATKGGRVGERAASELSSSLEKLKIPLRRLKTGTPSRLKMDTLDFSQTIIQYGDENPYPFSYRTQDELKNFASCWITRTTKKTHDILRSGFDRSPMFQGIIKGMGPRYCPSIEDKVNRFSERDSHQLFLEPEGLNSGRIYVNGFSSSLPAEIQLEALHSIPGLQNAEVIQIGYAVEYDAVDANSLFPTLESRENAGLYFAGQVNGTSGYEEAAGQGLIAGINAVLKLDNKEPFILGRADSYIGVMIDDLVNLPIDEPYRMFTSRAEYRLFLRQDNAEKRLLKRGLELGMVEQSLFDKFQGEEKKIALLKSRFTAKLLKQEQVNPYLESISSAPVKESIRAVKLLGRPGIDVNRLAEISGIDLQLNRLEMLRFTAEELYSGFYERQAREIERVKKMESFRITPDLDYHLCKTMSMEARNALSAKKPLTIGQARGVPGVRPVDITALIHFIEQGN